jgi:phosphatidate cytidylyltransferase
MGALTKRILVAVPAIALLLFATFWEQTYLLKALAVLSLGLAFSEYLKLADGKKIRTLRVEGFFALGLILLPWVFGNDVGVDGQGAVLAGFGILILSFMGSNRPLKEMVTSVSVTFWGAVYFGLLGAYFFRLRDLPQGAWHLLWLFIATWAYDTGGYFAGSFWGKHHFAPLISPKKSVEGCAGGFVLVFLGLFLLWKEVPFLGSFYTLVDVVALSVLLSVFAQLGDLAESMIKRGLAAKDSGSLLPGHGGIFDRIDSLLFNAPLLFYYLVLFKK